LFSGEVGAAGWRDLEAFVVSKPPLADVALGHQSPGDLHGVVSADKGVGAAALRLGGEVFEEGAL
jgi:hypothetical protein